MATPLVAGCAAILREVLAKHGSMTPSAALIKALIINGAVPLPGVPMEAQGFGRVNLKNSVAMATAAMHSGDRPLFPSSSNEGRPLKQGEKFEFDIEIPSNPGQGTKGDFKITLVYTDPPQGVLQNNLNLVVLGPDGKERHGNGFEEDRYDEVNNVEQVVLKEISAGIIKVIVWAQKITAPNGEQPFALAWSLM
jgi:serine protease AprX